MQRKVIFQTFSCWYIWQQFRDLSHLIQLTRKVKAVGNWIWKLVLRRWERNKLMRSQAPPNQTTEPEPGVPAPACAPWAERPKTWFCLSRDGRSYSTRQMTCLYPQSASQLVLGLVERKKLISWIPLSLKSWPWTVISLCRRGVCFCEWCCMCPSVPFIVWEAAPRPRRSPVGLGFLLPHSSRVGGMIS